MIGTGTIQANGVTVTTMSFQLRRHPLLFAMTEHVTAPGHQQSLAAIITATAFYIGDPVLARSFGKPWIKAQFSSIRSGSVLQQLLQNLQNAGPQSGTLFLSAVSAARQAGTQVIGGVRTTGYTAAVSPSAALRAEPAALRQRLRAAFNHLSGDIKVTMWIDARHNLRKVSVAESAAGNLISTTITYTAINQPLTITLPPASQVAQAPPSLLGG